MSSLQVFSYNDFSIEFELINGEVYANATAMCKPFVKRPNDWYVLPDTQRYIEGITRKSGNSDYQLFIKKPGNPEFGGGTWIHEKLILKLAQWLDVDFEIWCDDRVSELLKGKSVQLAQPSYTIDDPIKRAEQWIREAKEKQALVFENAELKPQAEYAQAVLMSETALTTTMIAKDLGMTAQGLNKLLKQRGVQFKQSGIWNLTAKYAGKGYAKLRTFPFVGKDGTHRTDYLLVWTETGRQFINTLLSPPQTPSQQLLPATA